MCCSGSNWSRNFGNNINVSVKCKVLSDTTKHLSISVSPNTETANYTWYKKEPGATNYERTQDDTSELMADAKSDYAVLVSTPSGNIFREIENCAGEREETNYGDIEDDTNNNTDTTIVGVNTEDYSFQLVSNEIAVYKRRTYAESWTINFSEVGWRTAVVVEVVDLELSKFNLIKPSWQYNNDKQEAIISFIAPARGVVTVHKIR